jgi:hypothetical protein
MMAKKISSRAPSARVSARITTSATSATPAATQSVRCEIEMVRRLAAASLERTQRFQLTWTAHCEKDRCA